MITKFISAPVIALLLNGFVYSSTTQAQEPTTLPPVPEAEATEDGPDVTATGSEASTSLDSSPLVLMGANGTAWQITEDGHVVTERNVMIGADGQGSIALDLPYSGYMRVTEMGSQPANIATTITDGEIETAASSARIVSPQTAQLAISAAPGPVLLQIEAWPEIDITEPNDDALVAWPLDLGLTYATPLLPSGDVDMFRFNLERMSDVEFRRHDSGPNLDVRYLSADTGAELGRGARTRLDAGEFILKLSWADTNTFMPQPVLFTLDPTGLIERPAPDRQTLIVGSPTEIFLLDESRGEFSLKIEEPGAYSFVTSNVGDQVTYTLRQGSDEIYNFPVAHLSKGEYKLNLFPIYRSAFPPFISVYKERDGDPLEPNDFQSDATPLIMDEAKEMIIEAGRSQDWITITPKRDGQLFLQAEIVDQASDSCDDLQLIYSVIMETGQEKGVTATLSGAVSGRVFGPIEVVANDPFHALLHCASPARADTKFTIYPSMPQAGDATGNSDIFVVAIEPDDNLRGALQIATMTNDVQFLEAEEASQLNERIQEIVRETERSRNSLLLPIIVLLIGALIAFGFYMRRRRKAPSK